MVVRTGADELLLDHLYIDPKHQASGLGSMLLRGVLEQADSQHKPLRVGALKGSRSNAFYTRHGFALVEQAPWDNHYVRQPQASG